MQMYPAPHAPHPAPQFMYAPNAYSAPQYQQAPAYYGSSYNTYYQPAQMGPRYYAQ